MADRRPRILLADADPEASAMVAEHLTRALSVDVTVVRTQAEAIRCDLADRHDVVLTELRLSEGDGLGLARELQACGRRPLIVTAAEPTLGRAVEAMRLGACDLLIKPFDLSRLTEVVRSAVAQHRQQTGQQVRMRRLREACRAMGQERRELRQRVDLICRDLVRAYGQLARKIVGTLATRD